MYVNGSGYGRIITDPIINIITIIYYISDSFIIKSFFLQKIRNDNSFIINSHDK